MFAAVQRSCSPKASSARRSRFLGSQGGAIEGRVNATSRILACTSFAALCGLFVACSSDANQLSPNDAGTKDSGLADATANTTDASTDGSVAVLSSEGTGGISCASTRTVSNRTVCVNTLGGSEFRFVEPATPATTPRDLVVYVHGDGARAFTSDGAIKALLPWSDAHEAITVAVLAPNGCAWWQKPTQTNCTEGATPDPDTAGVNADTLKSVLDSFRAHYNIRLARTFFYGASGGSIFLTDSFFRRFGNGYPGAYALNCGGTKPALAFAWDTKDAALRGGTKMFFTYGDKDFLKSDIEAAIPFFTNSGFPVDTRVIPNAEHCAFDGHGRAAEVFSAYLGE